MTWGNAVLRDKEIFQSLMQDSCSSDVPKFDVEPARVRPAARGSLARSLLSRNPSRAGRTVTDSRQRNAFPRQHSAPERNAFRRRSGAEPVKPVNRQDFFLQLR